MEFYEQLSKYYDVIFPLNQQSITFLKERITGESILDLAAGTGNHSIALAKLGYNVTATDIDENMVALIQEKASLNQVHIPAFQLAMENHDELKGKYFNTIICFGNSLVHLQNASEIKRVAETMYQLLENGGKLFIQIVNFDRVLTEKITSLPLINREEEQISFHRSYEHINGKILFKGRLTVNDVTLENAVYLYPLTKQELIEALSEAGFKEIIPYGSFKGEPYTINSPATIIEAVKS